MAFQLMACRGLRSSLFIFFVIFGGASVFLFSWFSGRAFGQESDSKTTHSSFRERDGDRPYLRDLLDWNWNQRDRSLPRGRIGGGVRFRAYNQKMAMRAERAAANVSSTSPDALSSTYSPKSSLGGAPASPSGSIVWAPVGPAPLASDATGDGAQEYHWLSGARHFDIDRSCGHDGKHGAAGRRLWR